MREFKKIIYGIFYIAVLAGLVFAVWPAGSKNCESEDCLSAVPVPLRVSFAIPQVFFADGAVSAFAEAKNSGVSADFSYRVNFYDAFDNLVGSLNKTAQFPASSVRLVSAVWPEEAANAEFELLAGQELPAAVFSPAPQVAENLEVSGASGRLRGKLQNVSAAMLRDISVIAVFRDEAGEPLWVGDTLVSVLNPYESADFLISLPKDESLLQEISSGTREFFIYPAQ